MSYSVFKFLEKRLFQLMIGIIKDTDKEKEPSNKTPALTESWGTISWNKHFSRKIGKHKIFTCE